MKFTILAALAALGATGVLAEDGPLNGPRPSAIELEACTRAGLEGYCGRHEVFEDREAMRGRKISLNIFVLPALGDSPEPDPLFFFLGGPGQAAVETAGFFNLAFGEARQKRDLVFMDQRGTGDSNPLKCDEHYGDPQKMQSWLTDLFPIDVIEACREKLEKRADLGLYTTPIAMDDYDEVRAALGYDKINLYGGSYGTRAVAVYLRRHPETVRAAIMGAAAPLFHYIPSTFAKDAQRAMDLLIEDCAADAGCAKAFPDVRGDLNKALARLKEGPVEVAVPNIFTDDEEDEETVKLPFGAFVSGVRSMLYNVANAAYLPKILRETAEGNWMPIATYTARYMRGVKTGVADGMYLSVTCAEDIPFFDAAEAARQAQGSFLGDNRVAQQVAACGRWVRGRIPEGFTEGVRGDMPVLVIAGELDPVTPPAAGKAAVQGFSNGRLVTVANTSHGFYGEPWTSCIGPIVHQFIETASVKGLDIGCAAKMKRPPFQFELPN